jgi:hypothetical protein
LGSRVEQQAGLIQLQPELLKVLQDRCSELGGWKALRPDLAAAQGLGQIPEIS